MTDGEKIDIFCRECNNKAEIKIDHDEKHGVAVAEFKISCTKCDSAIDNEEAAVAIDYIRLTLDINEKFLAKCPRCDSEAEVEAYKDYHHNLECDSGYECPCPPLHAICALKIRCTAEECPVIIYIGTQMGW